ncbi:MAG: M20/M25/M40 family metallo-hydrolase [Bacteroidales bacterium]
MLFLPWLACHSQNKPAITSVLLREHVEVLASPGLKGRYPGTEGDKAASAYIASRLAEYGLELYRGDGFQPFQVRTGARQGGGNHLVVNGFNAEVGRDFVPLSISGNGEADGPLVFGGYGFRIVNEEFTWDDYQDVDVTGKIVLILLGAPDPPAGSDIDPFEDAGSVRMKILNARDRGASAVLFVAGPQYDDKDELDFGAVRESPAGLPVLRVSREFIGKALDGQGIDIPALESEMALNRKRITKYLECQASLEAEVITETAETRNVVAWIPATDTGFRQEWVVVGAHFDHLGMGGPGSSSRTPDQVAVHPGADDNASGVAGMIEIAGLLSQQKKQLRRSVLFVAFAAEEMGLLGSKHFVEESPIDLTRISAMINLDMIGRLNEERRLAVGGTGTAVEMDSLLAAIDQRGLNYATSPEGYGPSDHAAFYSAGIPVLFYSTGAHLDYHTPADTPDRLNYEAMALIATQAAAMVRSIANHGNRLTFTEAGPRTADTGRRKLKVTLGIMPDVSGTENNGLRVEFATPGKPAQLAGIAKGDLIVAMNGLPVNNIYDYMGRLQQLKPGQVVSVEVIRNGRKLVVLVQL